MKKCLTHDRKGKESFRYTAYPGILLNCISANIVNKTWKLFIFFEHFPSIANYEIRTISRILFCKWKIVYDNEIRVSEKL